MTFDEFGPLFGQTFRDPEAAARRIRDAVVPPGTEAAAGAAVVALGAALYGLGDMMMPPAEGTAVFAPVSPFGAALMIAFSLLLTAGAAKGVGAMFGGRGTFRQSLRLMIWLQAVGCAMQAAQVAVAAVSPGLGALTAIAILGYSTFLLVCFVKVLHDFSSRGQVFLGLLGVILGLSVLIAIFVPNLVVTGGAP